MNTIDLLPKELHALEIIYLKQQIASLPVVKVKHISRMGRPVKTLFSEGHQCVASSAKGKDLTLQLCSRNTLVQELAVLQAAWDAAYCEPVPEMVLPYPVKRMFVGYGGQLVTLDRAFFDSLTAESNNSFPEHKRLFFNGIFYRSKAEREIARVYTDLGIEFKYEPAILLNGSVNYTYSDFVCWDRITQSCFFHEHMGLNTLAEYARKAVQSISNYTSAGIYPGVDIIYTFENEKFNFDPELTVSQVSLLIQYRLRNANLPVPQN